MGWYGVSFWGDEDVLKFTMVIVANLCEWNTVKNLEFYALSG